MLALERKNRILEKLQEEGRVVVSQLSGQFGVSEETIRRDLEKLETEGFATKSYGGAVLREDGAADAPLASGKRKMWPRSGQLPVWHLSWCRMETRIMLDASSNGHLYCPGAEREKTSHGDHQLCGISGRAGGYVRMDGDFHRRRPGGRLIWPFWGRERRRPSAIFGQIRRFFPVKLWIKPRASWDARETFAHVKQVMTASARESILAVDQTKFDRKAFARITGIRNLTTVITDEEPSGDWQRIFSQKDIRCMYPEKSRETTCVPSRE